MDQSAYAYDTYFTNISALNQATVASYATLLHPGLWAREYYFIFDLLGHDAKRASFLQGAEQELGDYSFGTRQCRSELVMGLPVPDGIQDQPGDRPCRSLESHRYATIAQN